MSERTELGVLNHLLEICRDGEHGFTSAAEHVKDPAVKRVFTVLATQRAQFAEQLAPHVHRLGGQATSDGSTGGALHRGWMNVKGAVSRHHDEAVLGEAERGERVAMHAYQEALDGMLPPTVRDLVEQQLAAVRDAHADLVALAHPLELGV
jgi:uncharacterized protein (TIGR02284 family)